MYIVLIVFLSLLIFSCIVSILFRKKVDFYIVGFDSGFKFSEINLLWKLARETSVEDPNSLYWSTPALTQSITKIIEKSQKDGTEYSKEVQGFLSRLFAYRTQLDIEVANKRGILSTKDLTPQKITFILGNKGVFFSRIVGVGKQLIITLPVQKNVTLYDTSMFINKRVTVYLWRKKDANYVFDTTILGNGVFLGKPVLYLAHADTLFRAQKRKSVRSECQIYGQLFIVQDEGDSANRDIDVNLGYRCLIEDISESGALIRIGGKCAKNSNIKLQFQIDYRLVVMNGYVCNVEYNEKLGQSRLHFVCKQIEEPMKNIVLSYVYKTLPKNEKAVFDAMVQSEMATKSDDALQEAVNQIEGGVAPVPFENEEEEEEAE
ncbi:MAG: PilZ domain-containing protein [Treponema sp.]|nr:PilZ domain-containing protein [Treponema sp.]